jgi:hypothetical protein
MQTFTRQKRLMHFDHLRRNIIQLSRSQKNPEVTIRTDHSDIDKSVLAIGSLTTTINEFHKSELKFREDE